MISGVIIFIAVWGIFILAAKFLPEKSLSATAIVNIAEIRKKYTKFELLSYLGFFIITPIIVYLLTLGMITIQDIHLNLNEAGSSYVIGVTGWAFAVPSIFMAMLIYGIVLDYVGNFVGKILFRNEEEYKIFIYDWNKRLAFSNDIDNKKLSLILTIFVVPLFLAMFYLGIDNYSKITDTKLISNGYFSLQEKQFQFKDIYKILYITKFKNTQSGAIEQTSSYYSVLMNDGHDWDTLNLTINKSTKEVEIINFISQKSGVPITEGIHNIDDKL